MSIQDLSLKLKGFLKSTEFLLSALIIVVSLVSFVLGRLSLTEKSQAIQQKAQVVESQNKTLSVENPSSNNKTQVTQPTQSPETKGAYVASKNGTKYHLPWCGSAKRIKEENKIWFATKEAAEKAGYTPAANCKGI